MHFRHTPLPELSLGEIDTHVSFLGRPVELPILISCMTGGSEEGFRVNQELARAAQSARVPVGMGSVRVLFEHPELLEHFRLRGIAPDVPLLANLGVVQVRDRDPREVSELMRRLEADALVVHLNPAQELFQPQGDRDFTGASDALRRLCEIVDLPVIIKETGCGMDPSTVRRLLGFGAAYVDLAGSGGTNWVTVESYRLGERERRGASEFDSWGIPTGLTLAALAQDARPGALGRVIGSGGLRSGMDVARVLAFGCALAGLALPFARAVVSRGADGVLEEIEQLGGTLRRVMLLTGSPDLGSLARDKIWLDPWLRSAAEALNRSSAGP